MTNRNFLKRAGLAASGFALLLASAFAGEAAVPASASMIAPYEKAAGIAGKLGSVGSDTLNNLMTLWGEAYRGLYPAVEMRVEGKGSSTAPPALIEGTAQLGPMSRPMKSEEVDKFQEKYGYKPTAIGVSLDALAVFVNKDNPVAGLSLEQVDGIFSKSRKSGSEDISVWGALGLSGDWAEKPISLYGRNSASGTYGYFKEHACFKGDFKDTVKEQPGSASVVQAITAEINAIGYSGIGYLTSGVRTVPLAKKKDAPFIAASYENVLAGKYPLSRMLYIYVAKAPGRKLDPAVAEFLKFVLSREGQAIVVKDGYLPLTAEMVQKELAKLK